VSGGGSWSIYDRDGASLLVRAQEGDVWRIERRGRRLRALRSDGEPTPFREGPLLIRSFDREPLVQWNGRRFRGDLAIFARDDGMLVVNRLPVEWYLQGVVPLEIGPVGPAERAAAEAQAVAARSYAYVRLSTSTARPYDVTSGVMDQVYGGADAERPVTTLAVISTAGQVLRYGGRVVDAPYHSTCGGSTAEPSEVWRESGAGYLQSVSDRIPGSDHYYCESSSTFRWSRSYTGAALDATLARYLRAYAPVPRHGGVGRARSVAVLSTTPSGRVGRLAIETDEGRYTLRGNDIRYVFRQPSGEILNSTYFSVESTIGHDGRLSQLTFRGSGNGHGIGMCQWGAIGRARAGQDYRTILQTYYPGTSVGPAD
jgi:stage II sporulation protein D